VRRSPTSGSSRDPYHSNPIADFDLGPVFRRQALDAPEDALGHLTLCRERPAALRARALMAQVDRIDADFGQELAGKVANREGLFPLQRIAGVAPGAALVACIDKIGRRRALVEVVSLVGLGRQ